MSKKSIVEDGLSSARAGNGEIVHHVKNGWWYVRNFLYWTGGVGSISAGTITVLNVLGKPISLIFR